VNSNFLTGSAETVAVYTLNVTYDNADWEDISLGPCTDSAIDSAYSVDETCIYVGNFGNNNRGNGYVQREFLEIFKFPEPFFDANSLPQDKTVDVLTIVYRYASPFNRKRKFDGKCIRACCAREIKRHHTFSNSSIFSPDFSRSHVCGLDGCEWSRQGRHLHCFQGPLWRRSGTDSRFVSQKRRSGEKDYYLRYATRFQKVD
jgi:hypothetical protein